MTQLLESSVIAIVQRAWRSIVDGIDNVSDKYPHWTDHERETGILKDIDGIRALVEPFLISASAINEPPIERDTFAFWLEGILNHRLEIVRMGSTSTEHPLKGFSAAPYEYVQLSMDYVDSAASLLCLLDAAFRFAGRSLSASLLQQCEDAARESVDFLLDAKIDDEQGVRWQGVSFRVNPDGKYANLYTTMIAAM